MKTLIVGGTGGIGASVALELQRRGHEVSLAARRAPDAASPVAGFPVVLGDYVEDGFSVARLEGFDALVFAACNDLRQLPPGLSRRAEDDFFRRANSEAVPRFFERAKAAGIRKAAYVGSFYPQARPELVETSGYVRSRRDADEGARALASGDFHVVSLNAPWVVGFLPGMVPPLYAALSAWALGRLPEVPLFAMPGGTNYISLHSLGQAILGGLARGENGRGYLVGDENLHFRDFFKLFFDAAGRPDIDLEVRDEAHPILTDAALYAGRNATIFYEPEGAEALGYDRRDIARTVREIVEQRR